jgi:photosystem II stability/assembly factor-like uncharacterized protein
MKKALTLFCILCLFTASLHSQTPWVELNTGITKRLNSISSIKDVSVWACGTEGTVIRSTNSGDSWINANPEPSIPASIDLHHIYSTGSGSAFVCGNDSQNSYIFKTSNSGLTWEQVLIQPWGKFNAVHFPTDTSGIVVGSPAAGRWSIWKTTNGGNSWDSSGCYLRATGNEKGFENSLWATGNKIWFGTDNYRIYNSTDFGGTWTVYSTGGEKISSSLWFDYDFNIGYSGRSNMIKTQNSGLFWQPETVPGTGDIVGITGSAHARFNWFVRNDNKIYVNPHNENLWQLDYTTPSGNYTYITIEKNGYFSGAVFAAKDNGGISRTYFLALGISQISGTVPKDYSLGQNYPNPFNPSTKIRFSVKRSSKVSLKIFDSAGRVVSIPANGYMPAGEYEVEFISEGLSSGVYFYKLDSDGFTETKKMVLLK